MFGATLSNTPVLTHDLRSLHLHLMTPTDAQIWSGNVLNPYTWA